jgi:UDP-glucose 4-epimerase
VYISDVVEGFVTTANAPGIEGETIDLRSGTLVPMRNVVDRVASLVGGHLRPEFGALPHRPGESALAAKYLGR